MATTLLCCLVARRSFHYTLHLQSEVLLSQLEFLLCCFVASSIVCNWALSSVSASLVEAIPPGHPAIFPQDSSSLCVAFAGGLQVFNFIFCGKYLVGQLIDLVLCLPDHIFFQLLVKADYLVMFCFLFRLSMHLPQHLVIRFIMNLFEILCTPVIFLPSNNPNAPATERVFSFYILAMLSSINCST